MATAPAPSSLLARLKPSPEERLLLLCARCQLTPEQGEELAALALAPLDWEQVLHKARWHGLAPLLFYHLRNLEAWPKVPGQITEQLRAIYLANVARNMYFQSELHRALEALQAQNIPVILLKGAALAGTVYQDSGVRPMSDLDLLVPEEQVYTAQDIIKGLGYHPVGIPEEQEDTEKHHRHLPGLAGMGKPVLFEVHRHILRQDSPLYFGIGGFWSRSQRLEATGIQAQALAPEDLLIHLSLNFFLDRRFSSQAALRQLCDVAESLRHYQGTIDWQQFLDAVQEYHLVGPVGCVMHTVWGLLDAPVPRDVVERLWPQGVDPPRLAHFLRHQVIDTRSWAALSLVTPGQDYRLGVVAMTALRRLLPNRSYLARQHHLTRFGFREYFLYPLRLWKGLLLALPSLARPRELKDDLELFNTLMQAGREK